MDEEILKQIEEMNNFIEEIQDENDKLQNENTRLRRELESANKQLEEFAGSDLELKEARRVQEENAELKRWIDENGRKSMQMKSKAESSMYAYRMMLNEEAEKIRKGIEDGVARKLQEKTEEMQKSFYEDSEEIRAQCKEDKSEFANIARQQVMATVIYAIFITFMWLATQADKLANGAEEFYGVLEALTELDTWKAVCCIMVIFIILIAVSIKLKPIGEELSERYHEDGTYVLNLWMSAWMILIALVMAIRIVPERGSWIQVTILLTVVFESIYHWYFGYRKHS
jgi:regulator of replication initiation timing